MALARLTDEFLKPFSNEYTELIGEQYETVEKMPNAELLLLYYSYYHYFNGNPDEIANLQAGVAYDKSAVEGIPFAVFPASKEDINNIEDDAEKNTVDILIPYWHEDKPGHKEVTPSEMASVLAKMLDNVDRYLQLRSQESSPSSVFERRLRDLGFTNYGNDNCPLRLVFLTNLKPVKNQSYTMERLISRKILPFKIVYGAEIESEILNTQSAYPYVSYGELWLDAPNNICRYENSLIVNLKANSLRKLYKDYSKRGLLAQNLRFYVKDVRVDSDIRNTIEMRPDVFWYLNNGITISCSSCKINGDRAYLENFSIVNGGQTTYLIGNMPNLTNDFSVVCKIISNRPNLDRVEQEDLLADVAVASNSQKKIQAKDLVANSTEQRRLKRLFAQHMPGLFYKVKRGETVPKGAYPNAWQEITPQALAQWLYSFVYQCPGPARTTPGTLFTTEEKYNMIFKNVNINAQFVCDLSRLRNIIHQIVPTKKKPGSFNRIQSGLLRNGELALLAIVGALYKCWIAKNTLLAAFNGCDPFDCGDYLYTNFAKWDVNWSFLNFPSDTNALKTWILYCLDNYLVPAYQRYCEERNTSSDYSGFTKGIKNYNEFILAIIVDHLQNGFSEDETNFFKTYFKVPTPTQLNDLERENNALKNA